LTLFRDKRGGSRYFSIDARRNPPYE
jgi:hypothetical protein